MLLRRSGAQEKTHVERAVIPARAEDVGTIEGIVKASYEAISGGVGVPRDWGRDRTLFDPNSRSVGVSVNSQTGAITTEAKTEQEFADAADAWMVKNGFTEREIAHEIKRYGNVATVLSSYEGKTAAGKSGLPRREYFSALFRWQALVDPLDGLGRGTSRQPHSARTPLTGCVFLNDASAQCNWSAKTFEQAFSFELDTNQ